MDMEWAPLIMVQAVACQLRRNAVSGGFLTFGILFVTVSDIGDWLARGRK